jgi:hypothetical protein
MRESRRWTLASCGGACGRTGVRPLNTFLLRRSGYPAPIEHLV